MDRWREAPEMRATYVLLAGGFALVAAGTAGVAASPALVLGLVVIAILTRLLGDLLVETSWTRFDRRRYVADVWVGPVVAAVVVLLFFDASAGEVQALGGIVGLVGMANYFLRPVYHLVYSLLARLADL